MANQVSQDLRRSLSAHGRCPGRHLDPDVRAEAAEWAAGEVAAGASLRAIAEELGVSSQTVRRWAAKWAPANPTMALVPVEVVADEPSRATHSRTVTVVAPGGYRVEGLTVEEAATLLRVLR